MRASKSSLPMPWSAELLHEPTVSTGTPDSSQDSTSFPSKCRMRHRRELRPLGDDPNVASTGQSRQKRRLPGSPMDSSNGSQSPPGGWSASYSISLIKEVIRRRSLADADRAPHGPSVPRPLVQTARVVS